MRSKSQASITGTHTHGPAPRLRVGRNGGLLSIGEIIKNANDKSKRTRETLEIPVDLLDPKNPVICIAEALRETSYIFDVEVESDGGKVPFEVVTDAPRSGSAYVLEQGRTLRILLHSIPEGKKSMRLAVEGFYIPWR